MNQRTFPGHINAMLLYDNWTKRKEIIDRFDTREGKGKEKVKKKIKKRELMAYIQK